jgi:elongation factor P
MVIRFEGQLYRVLAADYHPGQGRMTGASHARLRNLSTGTLWEHSFRAELKLDEIPVERRALEYLYAGSGQHCFMDPASYEQVEIPDALLGPQGAFLESGMKLAVDFVEGRPVSVAIPDSMEVLVADTAPASHQQQDTNFKPAKLDNGIEVMVPQFVKTGDMIRVDLANLKYMDRVRKTS